MEEFSIPMMVVTLWETFGWVSVIGAVVAVLLLIMLITAIVRSRTKGLGLGKMLLSGIVITLVVAAVLMPFVPVWTMAPVGDLRGFVDYVLAYVIALGPASIVGVSWVYIKSLGQPVSGQTV
ncbi:MAG: hypothetical protein R6V42_06760 [Orrella sp.]